MGRSLMSSILFNPIMRWPFQSTEEYREETLTIGSPMVFQTAPPQPASKARITWSPQLVGGAEASQNGFGEWILPAKRTERSGATPASRMGCLQNTNYGQSGAFAVGDGVDHLAAAIDAVASRKIPGVAGLPGGAIDVDAAVFHLHA